ncbi:hypothetical protein D3C81_1195420 [compost metagenome]
MKLISAYIFSNVAMVCCPCIVSDDLQKVPPAKIKVMFGKLASILAIGRLCVTTVRIRLSGIFPAIVCVVVPPSKKTT